MAPTSTALLGSLVALLLLPGFAKDSPSNGSSAVLRGGDQGVAALPQRLNASYVRSGGDKGASVNAQHGNASTKLHHGGSEGVIGLGTCSASDRQMIAARGGGNGPGSFPKIVADCGKEARTWFWWSADDFVSCLIRDSGMSRPCADCMLIGGQYGWRRCRWSCLFRSWCGQKCIQCLEAVEGEVSGCAGMSLPKPNAC